MFDWCVAIGGLELPPYYPEFFMVKSMVKWSLCPPSEKLHVSICFHSHFNPTFVDSVSSWSLNLPSIAGSNSPNPQAPVRHRSSVAAAERPRCPRRRPACHRRRRRRGRWHGSRWGSIRPRGCRWWGSGRCSTGRTWWWACLEAWGMFRIWGFFGRTDRLA